jgi:predicted MFS family arabinose efflux permease
MGGTIGWIVASWPLYFILQGKTGGELLHAQSFIFIVAGLASLALSAFSLALPHTPPKPALRAEDRFAWKESIALLAIPYLLVLYAVTFVDSTIQNGYFLLCGTFLGQIGFKPEHIMPVMSIGQVSEILTMALLGRCLKSLGWKKTMAIGILGHAARFVVFALLPQNHGAIIAVQALHGICYAFFFATVYIFIDAVFPKNVRASAQGLFNLLILGIGDLAAKWLFLPLQGKLTHAGVTDFQTLFLIPAGMALLGACILALFFEPPLVAESAEDQDSAVPVA